MASSLVGYYKNSSRIITTENMPFLCSRPGPSGYQARGLPPSLILVDEQTISLMHSFISQFHRQVIDINGSISDWIKSDEMNLYSSLNGIFDTFYSLKNIALSMVFLISFIVLKIVYIKFAEMVHPTMKLW